MRFSIKQEILNTLAGLAIVCMGWVVLTTLSTVSFMHWLSNILFVGIAVYVLNRIGRVVITAAYNEDQAQTRTKTPKSER